MCCKDDILESISEIKSENEKINELKTEIDTYKIDSFSKVASALLSSIVPRFFYTSHYDRMSGQLSIDQVEKDKQKQGISPGDQIFVDFLEFAGAKLEELRSTKRFEDLSTKCEAASANITDQIFQYWSQNRNLSVKVSLDRGQPDDPAPFNTGLVARARIYNETHRVGVPFSERSTGFVWFFSFLVQFTMLQGKAKNTIILLDEPGLSLHGKAQSDWLRYIEEKIVPQHQVIYSTHSPFMVHPKKLASCRIVQDKLVHDESGQYRSCGTKVHEDVMRADKDTLFPLQGALGCSLTQSLFIGENTLLVEGVSDVLYLQAFSDELCRRGRVGLDSRWTMCPVGGISKIKPFVSLFWGNKLNIAVLGNGTIGSKREIDRIQKSSILASDKFYTLAALLEANEAGIEDVMHAGFFCCVINRAYDLKGKLRVTSQKLKDAAKTCRQVARVEAYFKNLPCYIPEYAHSFPANWFIRNPAIFDGDDKKNLSTLERAELIFKVYNEMLNS